MKTTTIALSVFGILGIGLGLWGLWPKEPTEPLTLTTSCNGTYADGHCAPLYACTKKGVFFEARANGFLKGKIVGVQTTGAS